MEWGEEGRGGGKKLVVETTRRLVRKRNKGCAALASARLGPLEGGGREVSGGPSLKAKSRRPSHVAASARGSTKVKV